MKTEGVMKSFLEYVAEDIIRKYGTNLSHIAIVFPNKRASLFLNEALARQAQRPVWSPAYITISDLFRRQSDLQVADPIQSILVLRKRLISSMVGDSCCSATSTISTRTWLMPIVCWLTCATCMNSMICRILLTNSARCCSVSSAISQRSIRQPSKSGSYTFGAGWLTFITISAIAFHHNLWPTKACSIVR